MLRRKKGGEGDKVILGVSGVVRSTLIVFQIAECKMTNTQEERTKEKQHVYKNMHICREHHVLSG